MVTDKKLTRSEYFILLQARILACQLDFEGMKIENKMRELSHHSYAYSDRQFEDLKDKYNLDPERIRLDLQNCKDDINE